MAASIAHNEAKKIGRVLDRFTPGLVDCVAVVDDASTDETADVARSKGAVVISHRVRSGAGAAIRTAIRHARASGFDVLVILAGNDKDRPPEIERLLAAIEDEGCDFVQGSRYLPGGDFGEMPAYRQVATRFVHPLLFSLIVWRRFTDTTNGFRAIRLVGARRPAHRPRSAVARQVRARALPVLQDGHPRLRGEGSAGDQDLPAARSSATPR